jgi:hypothetical protein
MGDSLGSFTYYCTQGKSCVDYIIVSEDIVNNLNFLHVNDLNRKDFLAVLIIIFVSCSVRTFISLSGSFTCNKKYSSKYTC